MLASADVGAVVLSLRQRKSEEISDIRRGRASLLTGTGTPRAAPAPVFAVGKWLPGPWREGHTSLHWGTKLLGLEVFCPVPSSVGRGPRLLCSASQMAQSCCSGDLTGEGLIGINCSDSPRRLQKIAESAAFWGPLSDAEIIGQLVQMLRGAQDNSEDLSCSGRARGGAELSCEGFFCPDLRGWSMTRAL